ncbi:MAG: M23 family metallopeptidase [Verrucomicrobia bacterium]|nr:M23 family metallopeptidase [Verrucomicrobiota bacterium]
MKPMLRSLFALITLAVAVRAAERLDLAWPTPNPAWAAGKPIADYVQHAGSGDPASGAFGGVRNGGHQFHEGLDIAALNRDRRGEPTDDVMAAMAGVVRHISANAGSSNYGRYVVLEHPDATPGVYTLYAHLARIAPGLKVGDRVTRSQVLGTMGHSSGATPIPVARAHMHFEIGVMITRDFAAWYERRKFGSRNDHGPWNGMNLMGIDPLDFFNQWRANRINTVQDYFARMEPAVKVRIATRRAPDFIARYPSLLTKPPAMGIPAGWEVQFNWSGVPFAWTPLTALEVAALTPEQPRLVDVNAELLKRQRSRTLAVSRRGEWVPGKDLETVLQQLFGL